MNRLSGSLTDGLTLAASGAFVTRRTTRGYRYRVWEVPVPAIDPSLLNCVIYMYRSVRAAEDGLGSGGSGFLVSVPSAVPDWIHVYAVTNKHVLDQGFHVIRVNTDDERSDTIPTQPEFWTFADDDDIAVLPIDLGEGMVWDAISTQIFLSEVQQGARWEQFGPGDDAVLIGRLITHDGRQRNKPAVRFGNISTMADPDEPIRVGDRLQVGFLVECRSLSGYSGSPVLAYLNPARPNGMTLIGSGGTPRLLGVDCAHLPYWSPVCSTKNRESVLPDQWVETNSGIAVVVPAWRLMALLNAPHLSRHREVEDAQIAERLRTGAAAIPDTSQERPGPGRTTEQ